MQPIARREAISRLGGALISPLLLTRAEAEVTPGILRYRPEIEPLVALIERTPRERCAEMAVDQLRRGTSYRQFLAALFLAGIRNVNPRPPGFAMHCVFVVHSAHLIGMEAPPDVRLLPLFYVLDDFKASQERDASASTGDYTMRPIRGAVPSSTKAAPELVAAMEAWDQERAERAAVALARSRGGPEVFAMLWRYGARDYRNIGHKAIYVANACRTLQAIGWQHAEPVLRSLVLALLDFGQDRLVNGYKFQDQCYLANARRVDASFARLREGWSSGEADPQAARDILASLRHATPEEACANVSAGLVKGTANAASVWDAVHLAAAEFRMRARRGAALASVHAVTSTNALHYAYLAAAEPRIRYLMLLQAAGWVSQFRAAAESNPENLRARNIADLKPDGEERPLDQTLASVFAAVPSDPDAAALKVLRFAADLPARDAFLATALRLTAAKVNEVHFYKYLAALIEDVPLVSPPWQPHLLATTVYYTKGSKDDEPAPMKRAREALRALAG